jgi:hypothetical protein
MAKNNQLQNSIDAVGLTEGPATRSEVVTQTTASLTGANGGSSGGTSQSRALTDQLTSLTQQLQQLQTINQSQIDTLQQNTQALSQNTSTKGQGSSALSTASSVGSTLLDVFGLGSGLSPLISGLTSLFGGGGGNAPQPQAPYVAPLPVNAIAGTSASSAGAFGADTGAGGLLRPAPAASSPAQITVQVQAMDSQSFLDHSNDIAMAVRQAMLQSSVLNDVIREA